MGDTLQSTNKYHHHHQRDRFRCDTLWKIVNQKGLGPTQGPTKLVGIWGNPPPVGDIGPSGFSRPAQGPTFHSAYATDL